LLLHRFEQDNAIGHGVAENMAICDSEHLRTLNLWAMITIKLVGASGLECRYTALMNERLTDKTAT
jgi:hypothetical protein